MKLKFWPIAHRRSSDAEPIPPTIAALWVYLAECRIALNIASAMRENGKSAGLEGMTKGISNMTDCWIGRLEPRIATSENPH